jgi:hypothetical protein
MDEIFEPTIELVDPALDQQALRTRSRSLQVETSGLISTTYITQVNKTHSFPDFTLDPDCASGHDMNVGVSSLNIEGIDKDGVAVFSNTLRWLFFDLELPNNGIITSPRIVYDADTERFYVAATVTDKFHFSRIVVAVSKDSTPISGVSEDWDVRMIDSHVDFDGIDGKLWSDEIGLSVDDTSVYITGTMWNTTSYHCPDIFFHSKLWILDKSLVDGLVTSTGGSPPTAPLTMSSSGILRSATILDKTTATGSDFFGPYYPANMEMSGSKTSLDFGTYLVAYNTEVDGDEEEVHIIRVTTPLQTTPGLEEFDITLGDIEDLMSPLPSVEQPGSGEFGSDYSGIETGNRKVQDVAWFEEKLYLALTIMDVEGQTAVYWAAISATSAATVSVGEPIVLDNSGVMDAESISQDASAFYPSIALNKAGDVIIGFSASGPLTFAGMYAQQITKDTAHPLKEGESDTESIDGITYFGATSGISVDPEDYDCFWAFNQFARESEQPLELRMWERGALATSWAKVCVT